MIPVLFDYVRPGSVDEAIGVLVEHGDEAKLLAGGHSLLPLMKLRLATPSVLVDIGRLSELSYVRDMGDHVAIGAFTRHHDVHNDAVAVRDAPLLATVAGQFSHCIRLGERAQVLVDTGHHAPGTNIEFIVAVLLRAGKLGVASTVASMLMTISWSALRIRSSSSGS